MNRIPINQLVKIQLLNNANFGSAAGKVTLDQPTQIDAYSGLPFIPNSSLRGVLRNWWDFQPAQTIDSNTIFGTKDEKKENPYAPASELDHRPGNLIIGNGDVLAFPLLAENYQRCWIVPLETLCKYIEIEKLNGKTIEMKEFIARFYRDEDKEGLSLALPSLPRINASVEFEQIVAENILPQINQVHNLLHRWLADWFPQKETIIIVKKKAAEILWQQAAEVRDLTALDNHKNAKPQSLRRIETIPEGSVFISLFTWMQNSALDFSDKVIQIGSSEGQAFGFCRMATVSDIEPEIGSIIPDGSGPYNARETSYDAMEKMYKVMSGFRERDKKFKDKLKTIIKDLGWRLKRDGFETTLAFALARAHPHKPEIKPDSDEAAYRWLLNILLENANSDLKKYAGEIWFKEKFSETEQNLVLQRWLWLRKFSDTELVGERSTQ